MVDNEAMKKTVCGIACALAIAAVSGAAPKTASGKVELARCEAAIVPVSPLGGEAVGLLPAELKQVMSVPTLESRLKLFADDKAGSKALADFKRWRAAVPLTLKWRATSGETSPWMIEIGRAPDFSDARRWFVEKPAQDGDGGFSWSVPNANLEIGREYRWRVTTRGRCGPGCTGKGHGCEAGKALAVSPAATFRTEDVPPRWIKVGGGVENFRDLGGWRTADGRRVRQGLVFRGQQLNISSHFGKWPGRTYLGMEDVKYLTGTLGIRTDLDLRNDEETAGLTASPLGPDVRFVQRSSPFYAGIFKEEGKKTMAENFRLFCDRRNYPIYIHCAGGADRTGSLAYVLLGVLGVDRHDIETDWEATFYPNIPDGNPNSWIERREAAFNDGFAKYGKDGDSWNRRIVLYLLDCGVTKEEISAFSRIMLEKPEGGDKKTRKDKNQ